jgi:hypothetical protein
LTWHIYFDIVISVEGRGIPYLTKFILLFTDLLKFFSILVDFLVKFFPGRLIICYIVDCSNISVFTHNHHLSSSFPVLGLLRPVTGVTKLNSPIFSKVCLNFFSLVYTQNALIYAVGIMQFCIVTSIIPVNLRSYHLWSIILWSFKNEIFPLL